MKRLAALLVLAACSSSPAIAPQDTRVDPDQATGSIPESIAMGFDALEPDTRALEGDRVLLAVTMLREDEKHRLFVRVTRTGPPGERRRTTKSTINTGQLAYSIAWKTSLSPLRIEIYNSNGKLLATHNREARAYLTIEQDVLVANHMKLMVPLMDVLRETPELESLLRDAIQLPSTLSMLRHGGLSMQMMTDMRPEHISHSFQGGHEVYADRLGLRANDELALDMRVFHTWRQSPLLLTAGVVRIEGQHPTETGRRVTIEVVGAERGASATGS